MTTVYALAASDEPLQIRYIGRTNNFKSRSGNYTRVLKGKTTNICETVRKWIAEVADRKETVLIVILGEYQDEEGGRAERSWIDFWRNYCSLLNFNYNN